MGLEPLGINNNNCVTCLETYNDTVMGPNRARLEPDDIQYTWLNLELAISHKK